MRQGIYALGSSLLLLLASCSDGSVKAINCQKDFTSECEQELDNHYILSNPILRASFAGTGCAQDNVRACADFQEVVSPSQFGSVESKPDIVDDAWPESLWEDDVSTISNINNNFCDMQSSDYQDCVNFIDSLKGFTTGMITTAESLKNTLLEQKERLDREPDCYEGSLLGCDGGSLQQLTQQFEASVQPSGQNNAVEIKSTAKICYFEDGKEPVCRQYDNFIPKDLRVFFEAVQSVDSTAGQPPIDVFASVVCHQDPFCIKVINHSMQSSNIMNNTQLSHEQSEVLAKNQQSSYFSPIKNQQHDDKIGDLKQNFNFSTDSSQYRDQTRDLANTVCQGDSFCSAIIRNAISNSSQSENITDVEARAESVPNTVVCDDIRFSNQVSNQASDFNSSQVVGTSSYQETTCQQPHQDQNLLSKKTSDEYSTQSNLPQLSHTDVNSAQSQIEHYSLPSSDLSNTTTSDNATSQVGNLNNQLGDVLMQNKLNDNFKILASSVEKGRNTAINEVRTKQQELQKQQQQMQLLEIGRQQGQAEERTRMQAQASTNVQALLFSIYQGQEKELARTKQQEQELLQRTQLLNQIQQNNLTEPSQEEIEEEVIKYPSVVNTFKDDCDNNDAKACYQLANIFRAGKIVPQNRHQAQIIYHRICQMAQTGNVQSQYYCARLNLEGEVVAPNFGQGLQLLNQSCQKAFQPACQSLEMLKQIQINVIH